MGRNEKYTVEQKVKACEDYISGNKSALEIAKQLNMSKYGKRKIYEWVKKYNHLGYEAFVPIRSNSHYSKEFKLMIVQEYTTTLVSAEELAVKYNIRARSTVNNWITKYNRNEQLEDYLPTPEVYCMKTKKTTKEEKIEIVKWCIDHNNDYKKTANEFECNYAQVYQWVKKYSENGEDALVDNRGHRKIENQLSVEEQLKRENAKLSRKTLELEREIELLKKLNAFEWED